MGSIWKKIYKYKQKLDKKICTAYHLKIFPILLKENTFFLGEMKEESFTQNKMAQTK